MPQTKKGLLPLSGELVIRVNSRANGRHSEQYNKNKTIEHAHF